MRGSAFRELIHVDASVLFHGYRGKDDTIVRSLQLIAPMQFPVLFRDLGPDREFRIDRRRDGHIPKIVLSKGGIDLPDSRFRAWHRGYNLDVWLLRKHAGPP
jgi:hypothetical protein